jgi:hypothetical protein
VGVAGDQVCKATIEQRARRRARLPAEASIDRSSRQLHENAAGNDWLEQLRPLLHVDVPLGVSEHRVEPLYVQPEEPIRQIEWPADVGRLDEQVARPAKREPLKLLLRPVELVDVELATANELNRRAGGTERLERALHRLRSRRVVVTHVRCRGEHLDAVGRRCSADREGLLQVRGAVVEPGQDVTVEVDQSAANAR